MIIHNVNINLDLLGVVQDLTKIVSALALEMENAERSQDLKAWERIHAQAQRAKRHCYELVEVLHPGKPVRLNLAQCVVGAYENLLSSVPPHIRVSIGDLDPTVFVMATQTTIPRVLQNLIANVVSSLGEQPGTILLQVGYAEVAPKDGLAPGKYAVVSVSDCGPGMDEKVIEKMFEPGLTSGVGLACVLHLANRSGGCLRVASQKGVGTRVEFLLPGSI